MKFSWKKSWYVWNFEEVLKRKYCTSKLMSLSDGCSNLVFVHLLTRIKDASECALIRGNEEGCACCHRHRQPRQPFRRNTSKLKISSIWDLPRHPGKCCSQLTLKLGTQVYLHHFLICSQARQVLSHHNLKSWSLFHVSFNALQMPI